MGRPGGVFPFKQKDSWEDEAGNHRCLVFFFCFLGWVGGGGILKDYYSMFM